MTAAVDPFIRFFKHTRRSDVGPVLSGVRCLEWQLSCASNGYGHLYVIGGAIAAHRWSYATFVGAIPDDLFVLHKCDNRRCCEPAHLFVGTHQDNMHDMWRKGRGARFPGELSPAAKLTSADVVEIFLSDKGPRELSEHYRIAHTTIVRIRSREIWAHVTESLPSPPARKRRRRCGRRCEVAL